MAGSNPAYSAIKEIMNYFLAFLVFYLAMSIVYSYNAFNEKRAEYPSAIAQYVIRTSLIWPVMLVKYTFDI